MDFDCSDVRYTWTLQALGPWYAEYRYHGMQACFHSVEVHYSCSIIIILALLSPCDIILKFGWERYFAWMNKRLPKSLPELEDAYGKERAAEIFGFESGES
mmetsp:Transcript_32343/g.71429  ORF Transcript_32343/g.71429 Transcript_32343/m.71429 type:complete len:101 (-) Transcript_32343:3168-3470(-)